MDAAQTISSIGTLIGDPTRAIILASLLDGRSWTAGELARISGVTPQTISSHLKMLVESHLLLKDSQGRHRYFRLASQEIANMLESLTLLAAYRNDRQKNRSIVSGSIRQARTCYDHLAGKLGVSIAEAMLKKHYLISDHKDLIVTSSGHGFFADLGIDCTTVAQSRRKFAFKCLDWTERQYHLAGSLGAEVYKTIKSNKWIVSQPNSRVIKVTPMGKQRLGSLLDIRL